MIIDRQEIGNHLIKRNVNPLNETQDTPCTIPPIKNLLGVHSFMKYGNDILKGVADLSETNLTEVHAHFFTILKRPQCQSNNVIPASMSIS